MLNCYIIDDEQPAINVLTSFIKKTPFLDLIGSNTNALAVYPIFEADKPDLLFLDIQMPDITGVQFLQSLEKRPMVIFTTAYEQYALQGFELDILDYLVKPIRFERFLKAANKAHHLHQLAKGNGAKQQEDFLIIKVDYKNVKIPFSEIQYIEGLKDYVKIITKNGRFLTRLNLKGVATKLPNDQFIRVHRSYIVAQEKITSFQKGQVFLGKTSIPVGITYQDELQNKLK